MTCKNMKIEINGEQPLDEVVKELDRLGYVCFEKDRACVRYAITNQFGWYCLSRYDSNKTETTLQQLREMKTIEDRAHEILLKLIETDKTGFDAEGIAGYAYEIAKAMQAEAEKRKSKENALH